MPDVSEANRSGASSVDETPRDSQAYALGHTARELERLSLQAQVLEPFTRRLFLDAGLSSGMRVLDVGCGSGDVSLLAAEIVGPTGQVLGVDKAAAAIERAEQRAAARDLTHLRFVQSDLHAFDDRDGFDALIGRLVLMYLPEPADALRRLVRHLRADGIVVFHEFDMDAVRFLPDSPLMARCGKIVNAAFAAAGAETRMGMKLHPTFVAAGLPPPTMRLEGLIGAGPDYVGYEMLAGVIRSLLPLIEKFGIATAEDIEIDTLADRLREECVSSGVVFVVPEFIGAWSRLPKPSGIEAL